MDYELGWLGAGIQRVARLGIEPCNGLGLVSVGWIDW